MKNYNDIKWAGSRFEFEIIKKITDRAEAMCAEHGIEYPRRTILMDLELIHNNAIELGLQRLLDSPDDDFGHDILGIRRCWDRQNFEMTDCFLPRCAMPQPAHT